MSLPLHPFGPPMEASLTREGDQLVLAWTAAEDDWVILGDRSGAFAAAPESASGSEVLASSPQVQDFLAPHLQLSQGGQPCERTWLPTRDLLGEGVRSAFSCPDPAAPVSVHVDVLVDVNEAYRTVLRTGDEDVLFTASTPAHEVRPVEAVRSEGPAVSGSVLLALSLLLVATLAGVGLLVVNRRSRRQAGREVAA